VTIIIQDLWGQSISITFHLERMQFCSIFKICQKHHATRSVYASAASELYPKISSLGSQSDPLLNVLFRSEIAADVAYHPLFAYKNDHSASA
jgi:hypothetical protein